MKQMWCSISKSPLNYSSFLTVRAMVLVLWWSGFVSRADGSEQNHGNHSAVAFSWTPTKGFVGCSHYFIFSLNDDDNNITIMMIIYF